MLSDGRFATVLKPKMGHILNAWHPNDAMWMARLMTHVVGIDGNGVSEEEIMNLTLKDFSAISEQINKAIK